MIFLVTLCLDWGYSKWGAVRAWSSPRVFAMRYRLAFVMVAFTMLLLILAPSATMGQQGGKKKGPKGGGGDPNQVFDFLAKGRGYFMITEFSPRLRDALGQ